MRREGGGRESGGMRQRPQDFDDGDRGEEPWMRCTREWREVSQKSDIAEGQWRSGTAVRVVVTMLMVAAVFSQRSLPEPSHCARHPFQRRAIEPRHHATICGLTFTVIIWESFRAERLHVTHVLTNAREALWTHYTARVTVQ